MALSIQDSRILLKRSTTTSEIPTAAPSTDFTDGTWSNTDIYVGETFHNTVDEKLWLRFTNNIRQIAVADSPTVNRLTYWNASGHLGNIAAPTDGYYLKYTNASGYIWAAAGGTETQTWNDVLTLGNTTNGVNPFISAADTIQWHDNTATYVTSLSNDQATAANRTVYLPAYDGTLTYRTGSLTQNYVLKAGANNAISASSLIYDNGTNVGVNTTSLSAMLHVKGSTSDSTAYALKVDNSSGTPLLYVKNDQSIQIRNPNNVLAPLNVGAYNGYMTAIFEVDNNGRGIVICDNTASIGGDGWQINAVSGSTTINTIQSASNVNAGTLSNAQFKTTGLIVSSVLNDTPTQMLSVRGDIDCIGGAYRVSNVAGFTGTGAYTNFTISGGIITAAS